MNFIIVWISIVILAVCIFLYLDSDFYKKRKINEISQFEQKSVEMKKEEYKEIFKKYKKDITSHELEQIKNSEFFICLVKKLCDEIYNLNEENLNRISIYIEKQCLTIKGFSKRKTERKDVKILYKEFGFPIYNVCNVMEIAILLSSEFNIVDIDFDITVKSLVCKGIMLKL